MNEDFLFQLSKFRESGKSCVVVTLVNILGSAPQELGARIIVGEEGLLFGTIGGGKVEALAIKTAKEQLLSKDDFLSVSWNLQTDVGMTCGGVVGLFFEKMVARSTWKIAVFGAGHVAQELIPLLLRIDCSVICIDPREDWLAKLPVHSRLEKIQTPAMKDVVKNLDPKTFLVSVTMGHAFDLPVLEVALSQNNFPYVGVIGSEAKAIVLKNDLLKLGVDKESVSRLICPIGESFGNNQPAEIALSIVAQLIKARDSFLSSQAQS